MGVGNPGPHLSPISDERKGLPVKEYKVDIGGIEHTFLLDDEEAKARGLKADAKAADAPANKARTAKNKG